MKRRYLAGAVVAVTFIAGAFLLLMARSEPSYGGRSLSYWLNEARVNRSEQATNAIRALGTNAWPFLVKRAGAIDGKFKRFLIGQLGIGVKYWSGRGTRSRHIIRQ